MDNSPNDATQETLTVLTANAAAATAIGENNLRARLIEVSAPCRCQDEPCGGQPTRILININEHPDEFLRWCEFLAADEIAVSWEPKKGWTHLKVVADRDGDRWTVRCTVVSDEPVPGLTRKQITLDDLRFALTALDCAGTT